MASARSRLVEEMIAYICPAGLRLAHALVFALLKQAQEFGLNLQRQFADFIQVKRAAICGGNFALRIRDGTRESAFDVSEHLALQQFLRQARATHGDKRPVSAQTASDESRAPARFYPCRFRPKG